MNQYQPGEFTNFNNNLMKLKLFCLFTDYKNLGKSAEKPAIKFKGI